MSLRQSPVTQPSPGGPAARPLLSCEATAAPQPTPRFLRSATLATAACLALPALAGLLPQPAPWGLTAAAAQPDPHPDTHPDTGPVGGSDAPNLSVSVPAIAVVHLDARGRAVSLRTNTGRVPAATDTWLVLDAGGRRVGDLGAVERDVIARAAVDPDRFSSGGDVPFP